MPCLYRLMRNVIANPCMAKRLVKIKSCPLQRNYPVGGRWLSDSSQTHIDNSDSLRNDDYDTDRLPSDVTSTNTSLHIPVLLSEVLDIMNPQNGQTFLDMTFGSGGHTRAVFERAPECRVFGLDRDPTANEIARDFALQNSGFRPLVGRFSEVQGLLSEHGVAAGSLDGVLFDVGASSMQFDEARRGFSLSKDGPLDMRMDADRCPETPSAADVINTLEEGDLYRIFKRYGEERKPRAVARAVVDSRHTFGEISRTRQLADIVASVHNMSHGKDKLQRQAHTATRVFQALRIFVNNELNELNNGLELAHHLLRPGGVCVVISFHSLEDRIAKRHFHGIDVDLKGNMSVTDQHRNNFKMYQREHLEKLLEKRWEPFSKKVIVPSAAEEEQNPRARSAKLRAARKVM